MRPGAREESASPAWIAAPAMNARDTTKVYIWRLDTGSGPTLYQMGNDVTEAKTCGYLIMVVLLIYRLVLDDLTCSLIITCTSDFHEN